MLDYVRWLAGDTAGGLDVSVFFQYGALGGIAIALIWFARGAYADVRDRAKTAYQDVLERANRLEEENRKLNTLILDRVIPALTTATQIAEESTRLLTTMQHERDIAKAAEQRRPTRGGN